eukprot:scaffold127149_cov63-Phaeocystis_antarctica.AAC.1
MPKDKEGRKGVEVARAIRLARRRSKPPTRKGLQLTEVLLVFKLKPRAARACFQHRRMLARGQP